MNFRRIRMPITHHTPKARVGVVEQCLGLNQVAEGGVGALFRGLGPRLLRIPIYTAITLATFDFVKDAFQAANELSLKQEL